MSVAQPSNRDALIGRLIGGKFEIESLIGRGGMGAVYKAKQKNLKRVVAIKVLRHEMLSDPSYSARFKREANAASRLDHPNLMRVIDFGEDDGLLYIAMEFIDGRALQTMLREEGTFEAPRVVDLVGQLLAALAAMHDEGIIHRDLKPENVMVVKGRDDDGNTIEIVKLCDFGVSKQVRLETKGSDPLASVTHTATLTATGALVGTPEYMSPEQAKGDVIDPRSDLYAVGVMLYEMLTGRLPFKSANSMKLLLAHISEAPVAPSTHHKSVNPALEQVCLRALAKSPDERFANAREMRMALRDALDLRDSAVLGGRRGPTGASSIPPPKPDVEPDAVTRRGSEGEIAAALGSDSVRPPASSGSGIVPRKKPETVDVQTSTLASGAAPADAPRSVPPPEAAPAKTEPAAASTKAAPPPNRAVPVLLAIVVALLVVIAVLVAKK